MKKVFVMSFIAACLFTVTTSGVGFAQEIKSIKSSSIMSAVTQKEYQTVSTKDMKEITGKRYMLKGCFPQYPFPWVPRLPFPRMPWGRF